MSALAPATEAELAGILREAHDARSPLTLAGGGTRSAGRGAPGARLLRLGGLAGVRLYEPGALTLVAGAGTPLAEIEALLAAEGQALAFEPMDHRAALGTEGEPTIGGVVATNASGPRRVHAGACRDHLLGVRFVDGRGRILRSGGRVMKNVTGLDLGRLLCGARGAFGALTEVALKVLPAPRRSVTLAYPDRGAEAATRLFCAALRTPYEIAGAAWRDETAYLRIEGSAVQADHRLARLLALLGPAQALEGAAAAELWRGFRDVHHFAGSEPLWRIGVRPTDAARIARALGDRLDARVSMDWGGALLWACGAGLSAERVREIVQPAGGRAAALRGAASPAPAAGRRNALLVGLRERFDPAGILNPGIMVD